MSTENAPAKSTMAQRALAGAGALALVVGGVATYVALQPAPVVIPYPVGDGATVSSAGTSPLATETFAGLTGYHQSSSVAFPGTTVPKGWKVFSGPIHGDAGAYYDARFVSVANGMLTIKTDYSARNHGGWASGGLCQCGVQHTSGAYFVRTQTIGSGPEDIAMLWPTNDKWPPEVEFLESDTPSTGRAAVYWSKQHHVATFYFGNVNHQQWHTWGVVWTASKVTFVLDGHAWAQVTNRHAIPTQPLRLDLEQQTYCALHFACPSAPMHTNVAWVAEYQQ